MRRIRRAPLSEEANGLMARCQDQLDRDPTLVAGEHWSRSRPKLVAVGVLTTLEQMAGPTTRCFYCCDSRGADIEHFRPKARPEWRALVFTWTNLLLCCTACGRKKGDRFPVGSAGEPLLIDPTIEDPWRFLVFDEDTGRLVPRQFADGEDARGQAVANGHLLPLNIEAVTHGRRVAWRQICSATRRFLDLQISEDELIEAVERAEERGLGSWIFHHEGATLAPFARLIADHPALAQRIRVRLSEPHL